MVDVLIIGAGPAGLAAARSACARGATVTVLDSSDQPGGQFWRHLPATRPSANEQAIHHRWSYFRELTEQLENDARCTIVTSAHVWAIECAADETTTVHALVGVPDGSERERVEFHPTALILATGAHDRTLPFPGWNLPGVFTGGAAQALAKGERLAVGSEVVVAGAGPFLLPVAAALSQTGSRVRGVFEANRIPALIRGWLPRPWELMQAGGKAAELTGYVTGQVRHRIPYRTGRAVIAAHGSGHVESVTVAELRPDWSPIEGTQQRITADAVCISHGFTPRLELAIAVGCELTDTRFVQVDEAQRSSVAGVFAVGEVTGIGGVDLALAEGEIAGYVAAGGHQADRDVRGAARRRSVFRSFAARIEAAHGIRPGWSKWLSERTIICRCEEVDFGTLCGVADTTRSRSLRSAKLTTRAGLGACQGRICGRTVEELLSARVADGQLADGTVIDRRPIAAPIRLGELAEGSLACTTHEGKHNG